MNWWIPKQTQRTWHIKKRRGGGKEGKSYGPSANKKRKRKDQIGKLTSTKSFNTDIIEIICIFFHICICWDPFCLQNFFFFFTLVFISYHSHLLVHYNNFVWIILFLTHVFSHTFSFHLSVLILHISFNPFFSVTFGPLHIQHFMVHFITNSLFCRQQSKHIYACEKNKKKWIEDKSYWKLNASKIIRA